MLLLDLLGVPANSSAAARARLRSSSWNDLRGTHGRFANRSCSVVALLCSQRGSALFTAVRQGDRDMSEAAKLAALGSLTVRALPAPRSSA